MPSSQPAAINTNPGDWVELEKQINFILKDIYAMFDLIRGMDGKVSESTYVTGPSSSVDAHLAEFDGATGKKIKDGSLTHAGVADAVLKKHVAVTAGGNISLDKQEVSVAPGTPSELTISGGAVTVTGSIAFRRHTIDTEGDGATDDLTTITGGNAGEILIISPADDARTVVVKDGAGLLTGSDFSMDGIDDLMMLECKAANVWREVSRSDNG